VGGISVALLPLIIIAPIAPSAPAATATPPNSRFVFFFILDLERHRDVHSHLGKSTEERQTQKQPSFPHNNESATSAQ
jgi:hypothetical protein